MSMKKSMLDDTAFVVLGSNNLGDIALLNVYNKGDWESRVRNAQNEIRERAFDYIKHKYDFSMCAERFAIQINGDNNDMKIYGILGVGKHFVIATTNSRSGRIEKVKEFLTEKEMDTFVDNLSKREGVSYFSKDGNLVTCGINGRTEIYLCIEL